MLAPKNSGLNIVDHFFQFLVLIWKKGLLMA